MDHLSKIKLRPVITSAKVNENMSEIEQFQNKVLRPILKLQHVLILNLFDHFTQKNNINTKTLTQEQKINFITSTITKNQALKNQCIGLISGLFTVEEFEYYTKNSNEYNKRITTMIVQRIESTL